MEGFKEIMPYARLVDAIIFAALVTVLSVKAKHLTARGWAVGWAVVLLLTSPTSQLLSLIARHSDNPSGVYQWFDVLQPFWEFGYASLAMFLLLNWAQSRVKLDAKDLLFSFSGRIPRSVFWISACIFFPMFTMIGAAPYITGAEGLPKIIIMILYVLSLVLSTWIALSIYTKRWHDSGKSGWMTLILLIPVIGFFWFLWSLGFVKGTQGPNRYGDDPLIAPAT